MFIVVEATNFVLSALMFSLAFFYRRRNQICAVQLMMVGFSVLLALGIYKSPTVAQNLQILCPIESIYISSTAIQKLVQNKNKQPLYARIFLIILSVFTSSLLVILPSWIRLEAISG